MRNRNPETQKARRGSGAPLFWNLDYFEALMSFSYFSIIFLNV